MCTNRCTTAVPGRCPRWPKKRPNQKPKAPGKGKPKAHTPSSGDCVESLAQLSFPGMEERSTNRWQHRLQRERPTCTQRKRSLTKSADGRMASAATRQRKKPCPTKNQKNPLDSDQPSHGRRSHTLRILHHLWCNFQSVKSDMAISHQPKNNRYNRAHAASAKLLVPVWDSASFQSG